MKKNNFQSALNQPGSNRYFDKLQEQQGKEPNFWDYFFIGAAMFGAVITISVLIFLAHGKKNDEYKAAQIEYTQKA